MRYVSAVRFDGGPSTQSCGRPIGNALLSPCQTGSIARSATTPSFPPARRPPRTKIARVRRPKTDRPSRETALAFRGVRRRTSRARFDSRPRSRAKTTSASGSEKRLRSKTARSRCSLTMGRGSSRAPTAISTSVARSSVERAKWGQTRSMSLARSSGRCAKSRPTSLQSSCWECRARTSTSCLYAFRLALFPRLPLSSGAPMPRARSGSTACRSR